MGSWREDLAQCEYAVIELNIIPPDSKLDDGYIVTGHCPALFSESTLKGMLRLPQDISIEEASERALPKGPGEPGHLIVRIVHPPENKEA